MSLPCDMKLMSHDKNVALFKLKFYFIISQEIIWMLATKPFQSATSYRDVMLQA